MRAKSQKRVFWFGVYPRSNSFTHKPKTYKNQRRPWPPEGAVWVSSYRLGPPAGNLQASSSRPAQSDILRYIAQFNWLNLPFAAGVTRHGFVFNEEVDRLVTGQGRATTCTCAGVSGSLIDEQRACIEPLVQGALHSKGPAMSGAPSAHFLREAIDVSGRTMPGRRFRPTKSSCRAPRRCFQSWKCT